MDSKLVNEKAAFFGDRSVRINPAAMRQLGLEKQGNHLKIGEFVVSCVPFDEAPSFAFIAIEPQFNPWLASRMLGYKA